MLELIFMLLLAACSIIAQDAAPSDTLTDVTYSLGGIMSGPYRVWSM